MGRAQPTSKVRTPDTRQMRTRAEGTRRERREATSWGRADRRKNIHGNTARGTESDRRRHPTPTRGKRNPNPMKETGRGGGAGGARTITRRTEERGGQTGVEERATERKGEPPGAAGPGDNKGKPVATGPRNNKREPPPRARQVIGTRRRQTEGKDTEKVKQGGGQDQNTHTGHETLLKTIPPRLGQWAPGYSTAEGGFTRQGPDTQRTPNTNPASGGLGW